MYLFIQKFNSSVSYTFAFHIIIQKVGTLCAGFYVALPSFTFSGSITVSNHRNSLEIPEQSARRETIEVVSVTTVTTA